MTTTMHAPVIEADAPRQLAASLRRIGLRQPAQAAFRRAPPLQDITLRLVDYLTDRPTSPFTRRPLLDSCLDAALTAFFQFDTPCNENAQRYLKTLIARAADVLSVDAVDGNARWDPVGPEPLSAWLARFPDARVVPRPIHEPRLAPSPFRQNLALRLLSASDQQALHITIQQAARPPE
jgi:hypothetical protein